MRENTNFRRRNTVLGGVPIVLAEGTVVGGRYVLEARIGDGAMGTVYRAHHAKVSRQFAIKVLHKSLMQDPKVMKRFDREAELAGRLRHSNVVSVVDVGLTYNGMRYMAMELAPGASLADLLIDGAMSEARVLDLAKQMCAGLAHAHEVGLIHRDFKPENVIVEHQPGGREIARIVDFGVAILREDAGGTERHRLTTKGMVVGTPHYMAPEQARGGNLDQRVDIFALGLICYELLTGKLPFEGTGAEVARANLFEPTPPMAERAPHVEVDPILEAIVRKMLAKDPADRPASAHAVKELFELYEHDRERAARALGIAPEPPPTLVEMLRRSRSMSNVDDIVVRAPLQTEVRYNIVAEKLPRSRKPVAWIAGMAALLIIFVWQIGGGSSTSSPTIDVPTEAAAGIQDKRVGHETLPPTLEVLEQPRKNPIVEVIVPPKSRLMAPHSVTEPPGATEVAQLYAKVGRELKALDASRGMDATIDLWPRYRWIRINEAIATPEKRVQATVQLQRLLSEIQSL